MRHRVGLVVGLLSIVAVLAVVSVAATVDNSRASHGSRASPVATLPKSKSDAGVVYERRFEEVKASRGRSEPLVALVGDSFAPTELTNGVTFGKTVASGLEQNLHCQVSFVADSRAGYAYTSASKATVIQLLRDMNLRRSVPDLVILQAGWNDRGRLDRDVVVGVQGAIEFIRSELPGVPIVIVGPLRSGNSMPGDLLRVYRNVSKVALKAAGVHFVSTYDLEFNGHTSAVGASSIGGQAIARWIHDSLVKVGLAR